LLQSPPNAPQDWHTLPVEAVAATLATDTERGLASHEARLRLAVTGPNEIRKTSPIGPLALFLKQFRNLLLIILLITTVLSALVGEPLDAALILAIVLFCAALGFFQEYRAGRALLALKGMLVPVATLLRDGNPVVVAAREVVPGDVLLLEAGVKIAADARLVECHTLQCDEAALTGESLPVVKSSAALSRTVPVHDRSNMVHTGTAVVCGRGRAVVVATGMDTEFGRIAGQVLSVKAEKTPLEKRTEEIGRWLGIVALAVCCLVAVVSCAREALSGRPIEFQFVVHVLMFSVALAVAAVPEALAAIVTGALAIGMHQMAKHRALIRKVPAIETLGCTTVICTDKTGTLTRGEMTVRRIYADGRMLEVTGQGYAPLGRWLDEQGEVVALNPQLTLFLHAALLCNDADMEERNGRWAVRGDPTEGALVVAAMKAGLEPQRVRGDFQRVEDIPFSSERKRMTTLNRSAQGTLRLFVKGAPEKVLESCSQHLVHGSARFLKPDDREHIARVHRGMAAAALRVLAVAYQDIDDIDERGPATAPLPEEGFVFLGLAGMMDAPREEAVDAIATCKRIGIKPVMITGDHRLTAVAVACELGIHEVGDTVLDGEELQRTPEEALVRVVDRVTVYARVSPLDKLKIVRAWQKRGAVVAMTGDGVNDAPALRHADIGIAMGMTGTDVAREAADMVLSDDNFATIVQAVERGRWIYDNIKKYLTYLIRCNLTEIAVVGGVALVLGPDSLPLLPAAILYINLVTDGLPALALGVAPPDPDLMERPPRDPRESVFSTEVKAFIGLALVIEVPLFYSLFFQRLGDLTNARTLIFFLFLATELTIALNFRSMTHSVFRLPPHPLLVLAIFWEVVLIAIILQLPGVMETLGVTRPGLADVAIVGAVSLLVVASMEATKAALRWHQAKRGRPVGGSA
jgi:Ca2+-transporting ATPase